MLHWTRFPFFDPRSWMYRPCHSTQWTVSAGIVVTTSGHSNICFIFQNKKIFKFQYIFFQHIKPCKHAVNTPLKSSKIYSSHPEPVISVHCLFRAFSSVTVRVCPSVFRVHSWVWGSHWQGRPLPEADINAIFLNVTRLVDLSPGCHIFS